MVYIYKKTAGNKGYYYLRISERKGKRIISKDIAYLGSSIDEARKALDSLPKYKEKIRKAYKTLNKFLESNHYLERANALKLKKNDFLENKQSEIEACKIHYNAVFQKRDELTKKEILKNFVIEFAFNTTSIEGNTITLQEARNLLEEGMTPKNKTLREIHDLQNTEKVFFNLLETNEELSHEFIIKIHSGLMENIDARKGYRTTDVRVIKANFKATPAPYVKTDMDLLLKWYNKNKNAFHPLVLATIFHHKFEKIHPFMDGNGRTGRMLMNYIVIQNDYPLIVIHKKTRAEYLETLGKADKSDLTRALKEDYFPLVQFVADEIINSYWNIFL
jgi:Fic family protein